MRVFNIDISRKGISPVVQVTEYDAMSRFFTLVLRNGSSDYEPPENPTYSVWYKTKDSTGWYDTITLPDESTRPAVVADGNEYTIEIAEQATTSCGELALMINGDDGYQLTVSGIITRSDDIPGYDGSEVENYYNVYITRMQENAARAENAADIAVAYGATVEVDEDAQQLNITHHSDTEGGVGWLFGSAIMTEAEGSVAAFSDGANDVAVKSLVAEITPVQSGSGDPSPSNVRPISGRTGMTLTRAGKNLIPYPYETQSSTLSGITATINTDGSVTVNGTANSTTATGVAVIFTRSLAADLNLKSGDVLYFSAGQTYNANSAYCRLLYNDNNSGISRITAENLAVTITDAMISREINFQIWIPNGVTVNNMTFKPIVSLSPTEWQSPTVNQTIPITWQTEAGTIYGGTLDVVSGVLTVTKAAFTISGEAVLFGNYGTDNKPLYYVNLDTQILQCPTAEAKFAGNKLQCNKYALTTSLTAQSMHDAQIRTAVAGTQPTDTTNRIYIRDDRFTTAAALNADLATTPAVVIGVLATPQTYQLTPTEVRTLLGGNSIYTDAGSVSVEYVADTKLYIDGKVAELQALILEN